MSDLELLEKESNKRTPRMIKGLEHLPPKKRLKAETSQPGEDKAQGGSHQHTEIPERTVTSGTQ